MTQRSYDVKIDESNVKKKIVYNKRERIKKNSLSNECMIFIFYY